MITRSRPERSVSLCQMILGSVPKLWRTAITMSRSRLMPGKRSMPARIVLLLACGRGNKPALAGDLDFETLNHRVGEEFLRHFLGGTLGGGRVGLGQVK